MRFLLLSLPWTDYQGPSLPIGSLAAYARSKGFDVDARHLHLEAAAQFGFNDFNRVTYDAPAGVGEAICAALLFPREQKALLKSAAQYIPNAHLFAKRMLKTLRKLYNRTAWKDYSLVGLTVSCEQLFSSLLMVSWIKRDFPHIRTVLGGRLVAGELGKSVLKHFGQIDWCVDGEGEKAFISLLKALQDGRRSFENEVPGLMYRCNGRIMNNPRQQLSDLSGLPDSDFDHYFQTLSTHPRLRNRDASPYIPVEAGRGCIYSCAFCSVKPFWHEHRHRPSAEVAVSIDRMSRRYGAATMLFTDLMISSEYCKEIFGLIASKKGDQRFFCEIRADMTKDDLASMKRAGVIEVQIGIEALDTILLGKMNKRSRLIDNLKIMKYCEELGIRHASNLMIGFPTETQADIDRSTMSVEYASAYMPARFTTFAPLDGCPVYCAPRKFGITAIDDCAIIGRHLPRALSADIKLWPKGFRSKRKSRNYSELTRQVERWKKSYYKAQRNGRSPLAYFDCRYFIRIEDNRSGTKSITLDGTIRELYLFCDKIRGFAEIEKRFPKVPEKELRKTLRKLFKLKVMYTEDDDWLALAIHASPENRRNMLFL